ncbi:MAG: hypothetical protein V1663_02540 [archaeon]
MPEGYEKMRDKFIADGMKKKEAQRKAAMIWNAKHPDNPVTKSHEDFQNVIDAEDFIPAKTL